ncbi:enoyl-CoA hydratase [Eremomyces bilateralis CBS 781.70]|uniref:Enoyl-CoA hydratase n=1 Tax=Eremomyces bilateralis CBS 781.70 TaxID=1392243 RepID=A0A6G1G5P8_9PEZI|nr:enoyl-CoA hydratase [Eremomyces bilateralis CBS 781.70]KAF1813387.1 enoyl-CoA hydratase [Eremomyces bilateralis CBS 781.70]
MAPISFAPKFSAPPPTITVAILSFPAPKILLVTLNRPKQLNSIPSAGHVELNNVWQWLDEEPELSVGIITGAGRAFCAGADLKEWNNHNEKRTTRPTPPAGFAGLSRRSGLKPVIAAVNGLCFGGGTEMIVNCDMVVANRNASFALPEVKRGVVPFAGAPPRLIRTVGRVRAMEMALTGRTVGAEEAREWGLVNRVVDEGAEKVVEAAIELATMVAENSPDAVIITREGVKMGWEGCGAEEGTRIWQEVWQGRLAKGENMREGVRAFVEKRKPVWKPAKL